MKSPAQPAEDSMARSWALPGSLITVPEQPCAWGKTTYPWKTRVGPEFEPRAPSDLGNHGGEAGAAGAPLCTNSMALTRFQELCYGEFIKDFISTLKNISTNYNKDFHIEKVYKDMTHLTRICPKLNVSCCLLLRKPEMLFLLPLQPEAQWGKGFL